MSIAGKHNHASHPRYAAAPAAVLLARVLPVVLALVLLTLPILCIVHCRVVMQPTHHAQPSASNPTAYYFCDLPFPTTAHGLFTPAFLPGVLPQLAIFTITLAVIRALLLPIPLRWDTLRSVPPTPPPR